MKYKCPKCGSVFEGPVKFCPGCGQELKITAPVEEKKPEPKKKYKCPKCGTIFEGEVKFCPGCGSEIKIKEEKKPEPAPEAPEEEVVTGATKKKVVVKKYKCPQCGAIHDKPVKYCSECGAELTFGEEAPVEEETQIEVLKPKAKEEPKVEEAPVVEPVEEVEEPKAEVIEEELPEDDGSSFVEPAPAYTAAPVAAPAIPSEPKEEILPNEDHKKKGTPFGVVSLILSIPSFLVNVLSVFYTIFVVLKIFGVAIPDFLTGFMATMAGIMVIGQWIVLAGGLTTVIISLVFAGLVKKLQGNTGLAKASNGFAVTNLIFYILDTLIIIAAVIVPIIVAGSAVLGA